MPRFRIARHQEERGGIEMHPQDHTGQVDHLEIRHTWMGMKGNAGEHAGPSDCRAEGI